MVPVDWTDWTGRVRGVRKSRKFQGRHAGLVPASHCCTGSPSHTHSQVLLFYSEFVGGTGLESADPPRFCSLCTRPDVPSRTLGFFFFCAFRFFLLLKWSGRNVESRQAAPVSYRLVLFMWIFCDKQCCLKKRKDLKRTSGLTVQLSSLCNGFLSAPSCWRLGLTSQTHCTGLEMFSNGILLRNGNILTHCWTFSPNMICRVFFHKLASSHVKCYWSEAQTE